MLEDRLKEAPAHPPPSLNHSMSSVSMVSYHNSGFSQQTNEGRVRPLPFISRLSIEELPYDQVQDYRLEDFIDEEVLQDKRRQWQAHLELMF